MQRATLQGGINTVFPEPARAARGSFGIFDVLVRRPYPARDVAAALDRFFLIEERQVAWLDGLRVVAVALVFAFHVYTGPYLDLTRGAEELRSRGFAAIGGFGWSGVPLFFLISGFLVGGSVVLGMLEGRFRPLHFFTRRIVRTIPPALVLLAVWAVWTSRNTPIDARLFHNVFFVANYTMDEYLGIWWSLCVEEHFYLALCLLAGVVGSRLHKVDKVRVRNALLLAAIGITLVKLTAAGGSEAYLHTHWQLDYFLLGISMRLSFSGDKHRFASTAAGIMFGVGALVAFCAAALICQRAQPTTPGAAMLNGLPVEFVPAAETLTVIVVAFLTCSLAFWSDALSRFFSARVFRWIAGMSYSIYLTHTFALNYPVFSRADPRVLVSWLSPHSTVYLPVFLTLEAAGAIGVALAFYTLVERPILKLRRRLF